MGETLRQPESYWRQQVEAWRASGLSRGEYCAQHGLSRRTFGWWVWRLTWDDRRETESVAAQFLAIETAPAGPDAVMMPVVAPAAGGAQIEIALPDGIAVRVGADVQTEALRRVLRALGR